MYQVINVLMIILLILALLFSKKSFINFKLSSHLSKIKENERNELMPYLRGVFIMGLFIPLLVWFIDVSGDLVLTKLQHNTVKQVNKYDLIAPESTNVIDSKSHRGIHTVAYFCKYLVLRNEMHSMLLRC